MKPTSAFLLAPLLLPCFSGTRPAQEGPTDEKAELFRALALTQEELEESLALALWTAMAGDCEEGLGWIDAALGAAGEGELARRFETERRRLAAWIELRDAWLAEAAKEGAALGLVLDGKKVKSSFTREGDELVLNGGPIERVEVRALAPEMLLATIPKERLTGSDEWLKIYPYCVTGSPKWKRLTTKESSSEEIKRDATSFYPRMAALAPLVLSIESLAQRSPPADPSEAKAALDDLESLLSAGRDAACVSRRLPALGAVADCVLAQISSTLEVEDLLAGSISTPSEGVTRLSYDFSAEGHGSDWRRNDDYLGDLHHQLDPVRASEGSGDFAPGPAGFAGCGELCWRHVLEFAAPMRVSYQVRWEPAREENRVFAFAVGMLGDKQERHTRASELGFLYIREEDGRYQAVRPKGDAVVQLGRTYAMELTHDGEKVGVWIDGSLRSEGEAKALDSGRVFLWVHSDLHITVPTIEIEGRVTAASLETLRAEWVRDQLDRLGLDPGR